MMEIDNLQIGFIGAGRLGKALAWHCARRGLRVAAAASRLSSEAKDLAARIPACRIGSAQEIADSCDLAFVTTPDEVIRPTAEALRWRSGGFVVHCSGATEVSELAKAAVDGAHIGGFHPLQTFGDPEAAAQSLPGCTVTIEAEQPLDSVLATLAERLGCRVNRLPPGGRPLYHAAAGYTSQFINALLREASLMWQSWGASEADAVHALMPLVRGTLASIEQVGLAKGMPGPVSRGDVASVAKHVGALADFDPDMLGLYREMCNRTVTIAMEQRLIEATTATRVRALLAESRPDKVRPA